MFNCTNKYIIVDEEAFLKREYMEIMFQKMPYLSFPPELEIRLVPPERADIRFRAKLKNQDERDDVSVYYDLGGSLRASTDYWEIYPDINGDAKRFSNTPDDIKNMFDEIIKSLKNRPH